MAGIVVFANGPGQNGYGRLPEMKNPKAVATGRIGGKIGGPRRAEVLTPIQRTRIAKVGAKVRWHGHK